MKKELKKVREDVEKIYRKESGERVRRFLISWCITDSWNNAIEFTKKLVSKLIFSDINELINKTVSSKPSKINESEFVKGLKELKKEYCGK